VRSAVAFLTAVGGSSTPNDRTLRWFPAVGLLLGAGLGALWWGAAELWPLLVAAVVVVVADLAVTGLLHVDGLADTADGLLPPVPSRERRLEIMADPAVGAFGVTAVVAVLVARVAGVAVLEPDVLVLGGLWCASRTMMAVVATSLPYRGGGLAAAFLGEDRTTTRVAVALVGLPAAGVCLAVAAGVPGLVALAGLVLTALALAGLASRRLGGFTGDVLGALCLCGETVGLLLLSARW
jgi:adenosylcobinamide-GDP ribazoletransferase